jgi:hypothetical protein
MYVAHTCIHNTAIQKYTVYQGSDELNLYSYICYTQYTTVSLHSIKYTFGR